MMQRLKMLDTFVGTYSNALPFIVSILGVLVSIVGIGISIIIACSVNQMTEENDCRCFETIVTEVAEQLKMMYRLCDDLSQIKAKCGTSINNQSTNAVISLLWTIKRTSNTNWMTLPLHKYELHGHLFDKYPKKKKMKILASRIYIVDLSKQVKSLKNNYFVQATQTQEKMKRCFLKMDSFLSYEMPPNVTKESISEIMKNSVDGDDYVDQLSQKGIKIKINWKKCKQVWKEFEFLIREYTNLCKNVDDYVCNNENLKKLKGLKHKDILD